MKARTADDLRRRALALGAEVVIDGRSFNTTGLRAPARAVPKKEPDPAPAPPPALDAHALAVAVAAGVRAALAETKPAPPAPAPKTAREHRVLPAYDKYGRIAEMSITCDGAETHRVRLGYDADDLVTEMVITPSS